MSLLPFGNLPPFKKRRFVPETVDFGNWKLIEPLFDQLEQKINQATVPAQLEQWLLDWSELSAAIDEESSRRHIAMTCHTDSQDAEKAYLYLVEEIDPNLKPRQFKLSQLFLAHPLRTQLSKQRYEVFDRDTALSVELFRQENVPLETEEAKLGQQYQKLSGALTVNFRGEEKTLTQMGKFLEEPDRALRQEVWELVSKRRLQESEKFEAFFDQLLEIRQKISRNAGFSNYLDYAFRARGRFDYGPNDCLKFHDAIEKHIIPLLKQLHEQRRQQLRLEKLKPWDTSVDPLNRPPLRPFQEVDEMVEKAQRIFDQLDLQLGGDFRLMRDQRLLDLANRKGKAPGGYQSTLSEARVPFIFMNSVGVQRDVETLLHEAGHAFHALAARQDDLYAYRGSPIEFCEVASMSMELLGNRFLEEFYSNQDANRARRTHLEGIISIFPWIATIDAFQHWIYTHEGHTRLERRQAWENLMKRFGGSVDWSDYDDALGYLWHRQLHVYLYPFYYVEYGIAQLGALQVWANAQKNQSEGLRKYREGLALGGSRPLPELFTAAGCRFDFSDETVGPLSRMIEEKLGL